MLSPTDFRNLVSGRRRGVWPALVRAGLRVAEVPYTVAVNYRNRRFDQGHRVQRVEVPVVSVGNLTLGGTGKTPVVEWIARWFRQRGVRVAIVSRGYGASDGESNDEALVLEANLPDVPHVQDADRVAGSRMAIEEFETQLIVLDDGFQHRRLGRDLDIVLLDALEPFGWRHVFPRGTLREPQGGLARADVVLLSRADVIDADARDVIRREVQRFAPQAAWGEVTHAPQALIAAGGNSEPLEGLTGRRVAAFCGIGNPAGFRHTLEGLGVELVGFREFADHYRYQRGDLAELASWATAEQAEQLLCTQKDLVKIEAERLGSVPLAAISIGIKFLTGREALEAKLAVLAERVD